MKISYLITLAAIVAVSLALPSSAQTKISAPNGWTTQTKANGATTFTPSDLARGEVLSITIYDSRSLAEKSLEAFLRAFAGPVGTKPGQLAAPLKIGTSNAQGASAIGIYAGPNGVQLIAAFTAFSFDGGRNVAVSRILASSDAVFSRYKSSFQELSGAMVQHARDEAGESLVSVPARVLEHLQPGGALVPGIYAGEQFLDDKLQQRLRVYLYPSGEFRFKNGRDEEFGNGYNAPVSSGTFSYARGTGKLDLTLSFDLLNGTGSSDTGDFCFYGRNSAGKPAIYGEYDLGFHTSRTSLVWVAPLDRNSSPTVVKAREDAAKAEAARYKFVTPPGKGVKAAQIHAILHDYRVLFISYSQVTDDAYLLLKDGTVHQGLPVPPDQLDVAASRRGEPKTWGKWRKTADGYQVSWAGKAWQELKGWPTVPGTPQMRLEGRYAAVRATMVSHQFWGVTFDKMGRFSKDQRGGVTTGSFGGEGTTTATTTWDDGGASSTTSVAGGATIEGGTVFSSSSKNKNPKGNRQGTYSIDGYTLTLRYDNGRIVRLPFFFTDATRKKLWFEGDTLELGLDD